MFRHRRISSRLLGRAALVVGATVLLSGCAAVGYATNAMMGQESPAEFTPDKLQPLIVIAESKGDPGIGFNDADQLAMFVTDELNEQKVAPMIDRSAVDRVAVTRPSEFRKLSPLDVARATGARQLVYIKLRMTSVEQMPSAETAKGSASALVRVIDVATGNTLWPTDIPAGAALSYETPNVRTDGDGINEATMRADVQRGLAARVAKLFYTIRD